MSPHNRLIQRMAVKHQIYSRFGKELRECGPRHVQLIHCGADRRNAGRAIYAWVTVQFHSIASPKHQLIRCLTAPCHTCPPSWKDLLRTSPGHTNLGEHFIPTSGPHVKVPPQRIPANYQSEVEKQFQAMLEEGILEETSSPWMVPAVFIHKKNGDFRLCVD